MRLPKWLRRKKKIKDCPRDYFLIRDCCAPREPALYWHPDYVPRRDHFADSNPEAQAEMERINDELYTLMRRRHYAKYMQENRPDLTLPWDED